MSPEKKAIRKTIDIRLEQLEAKDFPHIAEWIDPDIFRIFHPPINNEQLHQLLTAYTDGRPTSLGYRIVRVSEGGIIGLLHASIIWKNDLAHIGQIIVGDPKLRGLGIGTKSINIFLKVCFDDLGLHRVQLFVDDDNVGAIACYRKSGFKIEGLMREATKISSGYASWYSMSILEDEWRVIKGGSKLE